MYTRGKDETANEQSWMRIGVYGKNAVGMPSTSEVAVGQCVRPCEHVKSARQSVIYPLSVDHWGQLPAPARVPHCVPRSFVFTQLERPRTLEI